MPQRKAHGINLGRWMPAAAMLSRVAGRMRHGVVYAMCHVVWFLESAVSASPPEGEGSGASKDAAGRGKVCGACEGVATLAPCCATCTRQHAPIVHTPLRRDLALILPVQHVHVNDWITVDVDRHQQSVVPCGAHDSR
jgi:hypothetical protein